MAQVMFIARMTVKDGHEDRFIDFMTQLGEYVEQNEPGTIRYELYRLREQGRFAVMEGFVDEQAAERHAQSARLAELVPHINECLIGTWEIEHLDSA